MSAEDRLTQLVRDAAESVDPGERLGAIRARAGAEAARKRRRVWWTVGGASLATAAAVAVVAVAAGVPGAERADEAGPAGSPTDIPSGTFTLEATPSAGPSPISPPLALAIPVYLVGDTPTGPRLYREFQSGRGDDQPTEAARRAVEGPPLDPDYRTGWPDGSAVVMTEWAGHQAILVDVHGDGVDLSVRPAGMTAQEARLAIQQVVFSVQGAAKERLPVQILLDGKASPTVLGLPMDEPVDRDPDLLALVNVTTPEQGQVITGSTLEASGVANSFEATVGWDILDADGTTVLTGSAMAEGAYDRLYPWATDIDVSGLAPGDYTFVARTDVSSTEGPGPTEDTKDFTID